MIAKLLPCPFCGCTPHTQLGKAWHDQLHGDRHQDTVIKCPRLCVTMSGSPEAVRDRWNTRADLARAQVAAAYERTIAALMVLRRDEEGDFAAGADCMLNDCIAEIRALTPDDAKAALDAMLKAERAKALKDAEEICSNIIKNYDVMKADGKTYESLRVQKAAKGMVSLAREDIRALAQEVE